LIRKVLIEPLLYIGADTNLGTGFHRHLYTCDCFSFICAHLFYMLTYPTLCTDQVPATTSSCLGPT